MGIRSGCMVEGIGDGCGVDVYKAVGVVYVVNMMLVARYRSEEETIDMHDIWVS